MSTLYFDCMLYCWVLAVLKVLQMNVSTLSFDCTLQRCVLTALSVLNEYLSTLCLDWTEVIVTWLILSWRFRCGRLMLYADHTIVADVSVVF